MANSRNHHRPALMVTIFAALGLALVTTAAPAFAANSIDVSGVGPTNVQVDYSCEATAGVTGIRAMVGAPEAEAPSAMGMQSAVTCDGKHQTTVVALDGAALSAGQQVQVRVALVDSADTTVSGQAKLVTLG